MFSLPRWPLERGHSLPCGELGCFILENGGSTAAFGVQRDRTCPETRRNITATSSVSHYPSTLWPWQTCSFAPSHCSLITWAPMGQRSHPSHVQLKNHLSSGSGGALRRNRPDAQVSASRPRLPKIDLKHLAGSCEALPLGPVKDDFFN